MRNIFWELEHGFRHDALLGGAPDIPPPTPPITKPPPAVMTRGGTKARKEAYGLRRRMSLAGQGSTAAGGYASGGATGGQTLMGG